MRCGECVNIEVVLGWTTLGAQPMPVAFHHLLAALCSVTHSSSLSRLLWAALVLCLMCEHCPPALHGGPAPLAIAAIASSAGKPAPGKK